MDLDLEPEPWQVTNDAVMGGVSLGEIVAVDNGLRFQGELSLENNGGFASVRRPFHGRLDNVRGIRLRVAGDGRRYQFRVKVNDNVGGFSWRHVFATDGSWQTIELLFDDFDGVFRGRKISGVGLLDATKIRQLGFLLADGKAGAFRLDIATIKFWY
jgi:hypothetical protein